jgi:hypothetical protein
MKLFVVIGSLLMGLISFSVLGQDLQVERIRQLSERKQSIYLDRGIFHNGAESNPTTLSSVRYNYSADRGYERIVFDFASDRVPRIYGHISSSERKIYIDFFDTKLVQPLPSQGATKFVESLNLFPITQESLSVELNFKETVTADIFVLASPGRLVIDIKK